MKKLIAVITLIIFSSCDPLHWEKTYRDELADHNKTLLSYNETLIFVDKLRCEYEKAGSSFDFCSKFYEEYNKYLKKKKVVEKYHKLERIEAPEVITWKHINRIIDEINKTK